VRVDVWARVELLPLEQAAALEKQQLVVRALLPAELYAFRVRSRSETDLVSDFSLPSDSIRTDPTYPDAPLLPTLIISAQLKRGELRVEWDELKCTGGSAIMHYELDLVELGSTQSVAEEGNDAPPVPYGADTRKAKGTRVTVAVQELERTFRLESTDYLCAFTVSELLPSVWYTARISAVSAVGQGPFSEFASPVATAASVPETLPQPPSYILLSVSSVQLLWFVSRGVDGGLPISRVIVEQFLVSDGQPQSNHWRPSLLSADVSLPAAIDVVGNGHEGNGHEMKACVLDLLADSSYRFRLSLVNPLGVGRPCAPTELVMTTTTVPGVVRRISAVCGTLRSVHVMWQEPDENGGIELTGFKLEQLHESDEFGTKPDAAWAPAKCIVHSDVLGIAATSIPAASEALIYPRPLQPRQDARVIGLEPGSLYRFRVAAVNARGQGQFSLASESIRLEATAPMVPREVRVVTVSSTSCRIEWHVPESCGGERITLYEIHKCKQRVEITEEVIKKIFDSIDVNGSGSLDKSELRTALLKLGKSEVEATRLLQRISKTELTFDEFKVHASAAAEAVAFGPWAPCAVVVPRGEALPPPHSVASDAMVRSALCCGASLNVSLADFDATATVIGATVSGLRPGRKYRYRVRCRNSSVVNDGFSEWSSRTATVLARVCVPSAVPEVRCEMLSATCIRLRWLPPLVLGGLAIRSYEFVLRARDAGSGDLADPLPFEWRAFEPWDYTLPEPVASDAVADGKSDRGHIVDAEALTELEEDDITAESGIELPPRPWLSGCAEQLAPGVNYEFMVRAVNREGPGAFSEGVCCWTSTCEPAAPTRLRACDEHTRARSCVLAWEAVRCSGGVPLLCYDLEQRMLREGEAAVGDDCDDGTESAVVAEWTPCIIDPSFALLSPPQIADLTDQLVSELIISVHAAINDMLRAPVEAIATETDGLADFAAESGAVGPAKGPRSSLMQFAASVSLNCSAKVLGLRPGRRCAPAYVAAVLNLGGQSWDSRVLRSLSCAAYL
jgi:hypothetical protein